MTAVVTALELPHLAVQHCLFCPFPDMSLTVLLRSAERALRPASLSAWAALQWASFSGRAWLVTQMCGVSRRRAKVGAAAGSPLPAAGRPAGVR